MKSSPQGQMHQGTAGELLREEREGAQVPAAAAHPSARNAATPAQPCARTLMRNHHLRGEAIRAFPLHPYCLGAS